MTPNCARACGFLQTICKLTERSLQSFVRHRTALTMLRRAHLQGLHPQRLAGGKQLSPFFLNKYAATRSTSTLARAQQQQDSATPSSASTLSALENLLGDAEGKGERMCSHGCDGMLRLRRGRPPCRVQVPADMRMGLRMEYLHLQGKDSNTISLQIS